MKKKVAILAVYNVYNYGSILQTYATQKVITELGFDNVIIRNDYRSPIGQLKRCFNFPLVAMKLNFVFRDFYVKHFNRELNLYFKTRKNAFDTFIKDNLQFSPDWGRLENIARHLKEYDYVLVGSDQVWNPMNIGKHFFTMEFVPDSVKKIAYAPSFGVSSIPKNQREETVHYLSRIDSLSVREISGQRIIETLIGKKVPVVADPTILVPLKYWQTFVMEHPYHDKKYILCYFLGKTQSHRDFAKKLSQLTGIDVVSLPHSDRICKADFNFGNYSPLGVGPKEFVNLVAHAEYVCTDSFHATVFSNLFSRKFFSFPRYADANSTASTNSRIPSLLHLLGDENRFMSSNCEPTKKMLEPIDFSMVQANINNLRENSRNYLVKSLGIR